MSERIYLDGSSVARVYEFTNPWPTQHQRATADLDAKSARLAAQAEQQLAQPDATSALCGIGYAVLALRAELEAQEFRRDR
jgi:hypothetical protein